MSVAVAEELCLTLGSVQFVDRTEADQLLALAETEELVAVRTEAPGPAVRGNLGLWLEENIDGTLERLGAAPPGIGASTNLDASLSDQLYRARLVGRRGLVLSVPSLRGIANSGGVLDADDSRVLAWWSTAVSGRPVQVLLQTINLGLKGYQAPCRLSDLLTDSNRRLPSEPVPEVVPAVSHSVAAMELSNAEVPASNFENTELNLADSDATDVDEEDLDEIDDVDDRDEPDDADDTDDVDSDATDFDEQASVQNEHTYAATHAPEPALELIAPTPDPIRNAPIRRQDPTLSARWPEWVTELDTARGPKPLSVIERLFVSSYVPLSNAIVSGLDDPRARSVAEAWSKSFERSYTDAFDALRHRGKRPTMVLDVPDIAARIGRLHGARSVQLILVDALRFDLGLRVEERLQQLVAGRAALAERLLLWSALPTTTTTQLELIGRGPAGLKEFNPLEVADESPAVVAHGRNATTLRRVKTGHRELHKLDVVQASLEAPGAPLNERFDEIAEETSQALAQFLGKLAPRTLAFVFGDHGFHLDPFDGGTGRERHGGATPEEVLVPGFAWLVGDVH